MTHSADYIVSYAQNFEDRIIEAFFPDVKAGTYVDVGANHPFYHSVTKIFYDMGWSGINVEPNPMLFEQIAEQRPKDKNLMIGLGNKPGELELRVYHSLDGLEGISTLAKEMKDNYATRTDKNTKRFSDVKIQVETLKDALKKQGLNHIHFLKVDVEGYEYEVLEGNDWEKFRPELICIEANHIMKDWRPILKKANYRLVFNDGLNNYYLAEESMKRAEHFDYAQVFLQGAPLLQFEVSEKIRSLREQNKNALLEVDSLREQNKQQQELIEQVGSLGKHAKKAIKNRLHISKEKES